MFCKHQWGLIHIEDVWQDNALTYEGSLLHKNVDDPEIKESRRDKFISRSVSVVSHKLKMQGVIDLIEFIKDKSGIYIEERKDYYKPIIIEYKRGRPKEGLEDSVQLCAQAIAFEEMRNCIIEYGYLYYFQTKKREKVIFSSSLRKTVIDLVNEMNEYYLAKRTPSPNKTSSCKNCSFNNICSKNFYNKNARKYINNILEGS